MSFILESAWNTAPQCKYMQKDSATVLNAGDFCSIDVNGLAVVADATSPVLAYVMANAKAWDETVYVLSDYTFAYFVWEADAVFANSYRNTEVDLVINSWVQQIDINATTTDVFKVVWGTDAGTVWETTKVKVRLNKPISL